MPKRQPPLATVVNTMDTHRVIGIFTQEANAEAARMIEKPTNYCDGQGNFGRPVANEAILTLFSLTK